MGKRIVTGLILGLLAIVSIFIFPDTLFALFIGALMSIAAWEWLDMVKVSHLLPRCFYLLILWWLMLLGYHHLFVSLYIAFVFWLFAAFTLSRPLADLQVLADKNIFLPMGMVVIVPTFAALMTLHEHSRLLLLYIVLIVSFADTGAYFVGNRYGRHRLAPVLSPKKSWEGLVGGMVLALIAGLIMVHVMHYQGAVNYLIGLAISIFLVWVSILGDLFESLLKRLLNVKDSGSILPGHGGILDRMDSLAAAAPVFALLCIWLHLF